jgi:hypothetical protein
MSDETVTSVKLIRTGREIRFSDLSIGQTFFHGGAFWTRTDTYVGTDLRHRAKGRELVSPPLRSYGSCSFGRSEDTMVVEEDELHF